MDICSRDTYVVFNAREQLFTLIAGYPIIWRSPCHTDDAMAKAEDLLRKAPAIANRHQAACQGDVLEIRNEEAMQSASAAANRRTFPPGFPGSNSADSIG